MNTRRKWMAAGLGLPALAWTGALRAQGNAPVLIGWLSANTRDTGRGGVNAFNEGMAALGWKLGAHYVLEERHADGRRERLPALAQEIAARKPVLIVAEPSNSARLAAAAAPTTPIVLANGDPLGSGLVTSLARPGGMITGLSNATYNIYQKVVELLAEALPRLQPVWRCAACRLAARRARVDPTHRDQASPKRPSGTGRIRTQAVRSRARCAPTTSRAGAKPPPRRPAAPGTRCAGGCCGRIDAEA
jgi:hypothetical protein